MTGAIKVLAFLASLVIFSEMKKIPLGFYVPEKTPPIVLGMAGKTFNLLFVEKFHGNLMTKSGATSQVFCKCACGKSLVVNAKDVRTGHTKSCGCMKSSWISEKKAVHGFARMGKRTGLYNVWAGMKNRCYNVNSHDYKHYGGRGITVCNEWKHSFPAFLRDMADGYKKGVKIERVDNNGDYEKGNCKWATHTQQMRNKRNNRCFRFFGELITIAEFCEKTKTNSGTIYSRIKRGMTTEKAAMKSINA